MSMTEEKKTLLNPLGLTGSAHVLLSLKVILIYKYNILERVLVENIIPRNVIINRGEG